MSVAGQPARQTSQRAAGFTDPAAWNVFGQAESLHAGLGPWLALQCALIGEVRSAVALVDSGGEEFLRAFWPEGNENLALFSAIGAAQTRLRGVLEEGGSDSPGFVIAYPLMLDTRAVGGVAVEVGSLPPESLYEAMRKLQWGTAWLRERLLAERLATQEADTLGGRAILELLGAALEPVGYMASARMVATELAQRYGCERVSLSTLRDNRNVVTAISHSASFGKDMNLVRQLGEAMDEAVDQRVILLYPPQDDTMNATVAHAALATANGGTALLTLPMHLRDAYVGAITLERPQDAPFTPAEVLTLDALAAALAPILEEKRLNDRPLHVRLREAAVQEVHRLFGPAYAMRKAIAAGIAVLFLVFLVWHDTYRVTATAVVEGEVQRALIAPFNGFLREAPVRAGDIVKEGDLLAALDDRDLVLERLKWSTERQRRAFEYEKALGERSRAELRIAANLMEQAAAQVQLVDEQLSRARITAPFEGLVVSGDHSQSIGSAVQRGQTLFEISPVRGHRVILSVNETQIDALREGQPAMLVLAALPGETFPLEITRLTPVARTEEGQNVFRVEARPKGETVSLRPGMRGAAKIEVGRRRVIWIWTRSFTDWLRLTLWRWEF